MLFVRKNALQILIPKYGLEGTLYLQPPKGAKQEVSFTYNEEVSLSLRKQYNLLRNDVSF